MAENPPVRRVAPLFLCGIGLGMLALPAAADVPQVATDIAPVQSLVARVMQGLGEPGLILPPGASPHDHALRPSEAQVLNGAGIVFWVGPALDPWLEKPLAALASDAKIVALMDADGTKVLPMRKGASFEPHVHEDEGHDHEGHDHSHDDHSHSDHAHGGDDPHVWLDPENARVWLDVIASTLSEADPENAAAYAANAVAGKAELTTLEGELKAELAPVAGTPFIVFHDAYQYFEVYFGLNAAGSISLADGAPPGPARLKEVQDKARTLQVACAFREPQFDPKLIETVFEGKKVQIGVLDPLGASLGAGPQLYPQLLRQMAAEFVACKD